MPCLYGMLLIDEDSQLIIMNELILDFRSYSKSYIVRKSEIGLKDIYNLFDIKKNLKLSRESEEVIQKHSDPF